MPCPSCGRAAVDDAAACPACGTRGAARGTTTLAARSRVATSPSAVRARTSVAAPAERRPAAASPAPRPVCTAAAVVLGLLAVLVVPMALGPLAVLLAAAANWRGERRAGAALAVAVAGTLLGLALGIVTAPSA